MTLRFGLLGAGRIGKVHARAISANPDAEFVVDASALLHRHPITPYDGRRLYGQVGGALVRGVPAFIDGRRAEAGHGRIIDASVV